MATFADAQSRLNAAALRRFGEQVQLDGVTVWGDFAQAVDGHMAGGMEFSAGAPMCAVASADVPAGVVGKALVCSAGAFTVQEERADGLGLTILVLQRGLGL